MKKTLLALSVIMVVALLFSCTPPTAPAAPAATSQVAPPQAAAKQFVLKLQLYRPPTHFVSVTTREMLPELEKMTKGQVKIEYYDSESLVKQDQFLEAIQSGTVDIVDFSNAPYVKTMPALGFTFLPFIFNNSVGVINSMAGGLEQTIEDIVRKTGYDKNKIVGAYYGGFAYFGNTKKAVKVPNDARGLKFRILGGDPTMEYAKQLGITIVQTPTAETYDALTRGIVDGCVVTPTGFVAWKFMEPVEYFLDLPLVPYVYMWFVRQPALDAMPEDLRAATIGWLKWLSQKLETKYLMADVSDFDTMRKYMQFNTTTADETALWKAPAKGIIDNWVTQTGDEGKKIVEIIRKNNP